MLSYMSHITRISVHNNDIEEMQQSYCELHTYCYM